eukprot:gnl/TRDRNA2_/TRDRNA2_170803_c1_seq2.p1 gnl/TRDRNA2_/TRDRNA2_170803_c1~~gnl/TRDRNA2_/TRDRNA2_170803_c1_seq2.p1  ORF type:complete len:493 (-),score=147.66 gnl/TRDRNA2_/TRDRNA2_170803_c1_seq2:102-1400(-)
MERYRGECGKRVSSKRGFHSLLQHSKTNTTNPGAGIDEFEPYETVLKDGFMLLDCAMDDMYLYGDKFGPNKHDYNKKDTTGVSIVLYEDHVAKEDRAEMTHKICFEFCRTVPDMLFFGITNGRECYCAPYFKKLASDNSPCDSTCEGDETLMCGSKKKSSIFEMHFCDSTAEDLGNAIEKAKEMKEDLKEKADESAEIAEKMNEAGEKGQKVFSKVGDEPAADLMQAAKEFAGEVEDDAKKATKVAEKLGELAKDAEKLEGFNKPKVVTKAERLMETIEGTVAIGVMKLEAVENNLEAIQPGPVAEDAAKQYLPIMHFIDKEFSDVPQTCSGKMVNKPISGLNEDGCASACDADTHDCKGYAFFDNSDDDSRLCFLFSSFKSVVYYTDCKTKDKAKCMAKLTDFDGQDLKPKKDGKDKNRLKKLTKADRCYH